MEITEKSVKSTVCRGFFKWRQFFDSLENPPKYDKAELCTFELHHFGLLENGVYKEGKVLVLYYHDPTHNNELESEDKEQQQHSEDVGNEEEEEEEEKEDVIVDSDYELSEEENGNKEAASRAQPRNDAPNVEYAQCFEEMNEMPLNEATGEISDDDEDSDRLPFDGDSSGGDEDEFRIGIQFANKNELKEAIRQYAIVQGRNVKLVKNDNKRIRAKCVGHTKYPFILLASKIDRDEQTFAIKTLSLEHECTRVDKLKYTNSRWLSKRFADKIRKNPGWNVGAFKSEVLEKYHMNVSRHQIYRATSLSKVIIEGSYVEQYARLWDYAEELKKANKGSTVIIKNKMNEPYIGQVLTVIGVDGNNGIYPVAYAIVEVESKSNWIWFLELLIEDLKIENGKAWVFMSDKQKGLIPAIETLLPTTKHKMCVRHLYSNFKTEHAGLALKNILWAATRATIIPWYEVEMDKMKEQDEEAWKHPIGPRIVKIVEKNKLGASQCILRLAGESKYQEANVFDYAHDCYKKEAYLNSYEPMPGRPKKSKNKEPAEVEVPAPIPPNPLPPYYNPPPTKLRRRDIIRHGMPTKGQHKTFLISPTKEHLALLQSKGQLRPSLISPTQLEEEGEGEVEVGNGTVEMPNKPSSSQPLPSSSQPLSYTRATSSSLQPPKSPAKRFKSPAKRLRPWMF
ncbi:unnamed protein product [Prunus armeniaca]